MTQNHIGREQDYEKNCQPETPQKASQFTPACGPDYRGVYCYWIHTFCARLPESVLLD